MDLRQWCSSSEIAWIGLTNLSVNFVFLLTECLLCDKHFIIEYMFGTILCSNWLIFLFSLLFHVWISSCDAVWSYQVRNCINLYKKHAEMSTGSADVRSWPSRMCSGGVELKLIALTTEDYIWGSLKFAEFQWKLRVWSCLGMFGWRFREVLIRFHSCFCTMIEKYYATEIYWGKHKLRFHPEFVIEIERIEKCAVCPYLKLIRKAWDCNG